MEARQEPLDFLDLGDLILAASAPGSDRHSTKMHPGTGHSEHQRKARCRHGSPSLLWRREARYLARARLMNGTSALMIRMAGPAFVVSD